MIGELRVYIMLCSRCGYEVEFTQKDLDNADVNIPFTMCNNCGMSNYWDEIITRARLVRIEKELRG